MSQQEISSNLSVPMGVSSQFTSVTLTFCAVAAGQLSELQQSIQQF